MSSPARRAVLRSQLEISEELGHAFVEVPTDLLRELLGAFDISPELRRAFALVAGERARQERRASEEQARGRVEWKTCADPSLVDGVRLAVLVEEVGEVAHAMNEQRVELPANLEEELVHVAAVALAWLEGLLVPEGWSAWC